MRPSRAASPRRSDRPATGRPAMAAVNGARGRQAPAARRSPSIGAERRPIGSERLAERDVELDRPGGPGRARSRRRVPRPTGRGASVAGSPSSSGSSAYHLRAGRTGPVLVDGLRRAAIAQLGRPVGGQHDQRDPRLAMPRPPPGAKFATAVPDVTSRTTGRPLVRGHARARRSRPTARRAGRGRGRRVRARSARASGVERDPGQTTASRTPAAASSSTKARRRRGVATSAVVLTPGDGSLAPPAPTQRPELDPRFLPLLAGSESATMPQPANSVARVRSTIPHRSATHSSPSPSAPSQPIGPAYQPRSKPSCSSISASATSRGSPPTAGVGCSRSASASRPGPSRTVPVISRHEVLDVRSVITPGSARLERRRTIGASGRGSRRRRRVLLAVLLATPAGRGRARVLRRVGATPDRIRRWPPSGTSGPRCGRGVRAWRPGTSGRPRRNANVVLSGALAARRRSAFARRARPATRRPTRRASTTLSMRPGRPRRRTSRRAAATRREPAARR